MLSCPIKDGKYEPDRTKREDCTEGECPFWSSSECRLVIIDGKVTTREGLRRTLHAGGESDGL